MRVWNVRQGFPDKKYRIGLWLMQDDFLSRNELMSMNLAGRDNHHSFALKKRTWESIRGDIETG